MANQERFESEFHGSTQHELQYESIALRLDRRSAIGDSNHRERMHEKLVVDELRVIRCSQ